jgi:hypothetical protein
VHRVSKRYLESAATTTPEVTTNGDQAETVAISVDDRYDTKLESASTTPSMRRTQTLT